MPCTHAKGDLVESERPSYRTAGGGVRVLKGCSEALGGGHAPRGRAPMPTGGPLDKRAKNQEIIGSCELLSIS